MNFLIEGKTNWKFLLIVIILVIVVGGGILVWQYLPEVSVKKSSPEEKASNLVKSQEFFSFMESYESIRSSDSFKAELRDKILNEIKKDPGLNSTYENNKEKTDKIIDEIIDMKTEASFSAETLSNGNVKVNVLLNNDLVGNFVIDPRQNKIIETNVRLVKPAPSLDKEIILNQIFMDYCPIVLQFLQGKLEDETTKWKTYKNEELGYSIKYPEDWYTKEEYREKCGFENCLENLYIENMEEKVIVAGGGPFTEDGSFFNIVILEAPDISSIEEWIQKGDIPDRIKQERLNSIATMNIGGVERKVWKGAGTQDGGIEFIQNSRFYRIHYISGSKEQFNKDSATFNQMLSTFRFLE